jgi:hypothetical protein
METATDRQPGITHDTSKQTDSAQTQELEDVDMDKNQEEASDPAASDPAAPHHHHAPPRRGIVPPKIFQAMAESEETSPEYDLY